MGCRERAGEMGCEMIPAEILQFGPGKTQKVRIQMQAGEYAGLDLWLPRQRLKVLWADSGHWLTDESAFEQARLASIDAPGSTARRYWSSIPIPAKVKSVWSGAQ